MLKTVMLTTLLSVVVGQTLSAATSASVKSDHSERPASMVAGGEKEYQSLLKSGNEDWVNSFWSRRFGMAMDFVSHPLKKNKSRPNQGESVQILRPPDTVNPQVSLRAPPIG